ncbi:hypothetical protein VPH35_086554 [Triticum aestivum]
MAAVESGEVVKATALAITSPANDMKSDGTQELQSSPANVSLDLEEEELLIRSLQYDLWMRLIVAHHIQKLKLDMKKDIYIYSSLLSDNGGESDRLRRSVLASLAARESESDDDDDCTAEADVDGSEEEHQSVALREFRDLYARASDVDRRFEEFDGIMWAHYDPDLEDNETRKATVARLWRRLEKELDDRADAVVSGAFNYSFAPPTPRHQSLR